MKKIHPSEAQEQCALIRWAEITNIKPLTNCIEDCSTCEGKIGNYLFAIPNGGSRHPIEAVHLQKQGIKAGVPDLMFALPWKGYGGLFIEMKSKKGVMRPTQKEWKNRLESVGYKVEICFGFEEAKKAIEEYLA